MGSQTSRPPLAGAPEPRSEEALRLSEERFRLLVDSVKDYAIFILGPAGHVETWNAGAERIKGYRADEIIGQHFSRFYPDDDVRDGKTARELEIASAEGRFEEEGWRIRKDGTSFWANVVITALRGPAGEVVGFAKVTRDLTERRKLEIERVKVARAEESVRLRDEFLSIASHELKTPLSSLLLQLESLRSRLDAAEPALVTRVDRATRSGERLAQLVETLLDVSRIATGRFELKLTSFDLGDAVVEVVERMRHDAERAGCALALRPAPAPVVGTWDRLRVEQIVTNLLSNATKYAAGAAVAVSVSAQGDHGVIEVRDHGPGIQESEQARIFGRFERGVSMRHYGGMGLGLYVVDQIVQAHGGTVRAVNAPDGGAVVRVAIPCTPPERAAPDPRAEGN